MTLLRAKPKEKKTHFERFIVLGDADPKHVEERLGNAMISNEVISKLKPETHRGQPQMHDFSANSPDFLLNTSDRLGNNNSSSLV